MCAIYAWDQHHGTAAQRAAALRNLIKAAGGVGRIPRYCGAVAPGTSRAHTPHPAAKRAAPGQRPHPHGKGHGNGNGNGKGKGKGNSEGGGGNGNGNGNSSSGGNGNGDSSSGGNGNSGGGGNGGPAGNGNSHPGGGPGNPHANDQGNPHRHGSLLAASQHNNSSHGVGHRGGRAAHGRRAHRTPHATG
jgi:hypothetical protein